MDEENQDQQTFVYYSYFWNVCELETLSDILLQSGTFQFLSRTVREQSSLSEFFFHKIYSNLTKITAIYNLSSYESIGLVADKYGSYAPAFYAGGGISIVAGALMFLLHCCKDSDSSDGTRKEEIQIEKITFDTKL